MIIVKAFGVGRSWSACGLRPGPSAGCGGSGWGMFRAPIRDPFGPIPWGQSLFGVTLRPQPVDAAGTVQPLIDLGFALQPCDVASFGARILGDDLPIALRYALHFESDFEFCHGQPILALRSDWQAKMSALIARDEHRRMADSAALPYRRCSMPTVRS